jgi:uncharacterized membrane protein
MPDEDSARAEERGAGVHASSASESLAGDLAAPRADAGGAVPAGAPPTQDAAEAAAPEGPVSSEAVEPELRLSTILGPLPAGVSAKKTRDLNDAVHQILVIGLAISTVLLVAGLALELIENKQLPNEVLSVDQALQRTLQLRPSGFLSLGLLALMFTPIVRVIGSVIVFIWERDRRYTLITLVVLAVMTISVLVGHG